MFRTCLCALVVVFLTTGCTKPRPQGDPDGVPVTFRVNLDRGISSAFPRSGSNVRTGMGVGTGTRGTSVGFGVSVSHQSTNAAILGGDIALSRSLFTHRGRWGTSEFSVPLRPGRTLYLTLEISGGRTGMENLGQITIPTETATGVVMIQVSEQGRQVAWVDAE